MRVRQHHLGALLRWGAAGVLVLALCWAQALGQWHRVAHAPGLAHDAPAPGLVPHADPSHAGEGGWLAHLFGGEGHAGSCVLYDQLGHADGAPSLPLVWLPPVWVAAVPPWEGRWQIAAQAIGFLARGPPASA